MRVGLLDITAAGVTLVAVLLPPPMRTVTASPPVSDALRSDVAAAQADLVLSPRSGANARRLADRLIDAKQTDGAIRVAAAAASTEGITERWEPLLAVSEAHIERLEIKPALEWGQKALEACEAAGAACAVHERVRLETYTNALAAGVRSGIAPRIDPRGFDQAVKRSIPRIIVRPPREPRGGPASQPTR